MIYARYTDIPGLYDAFDAELNPLASELTVRQLHHFAMQRGEQVEIVPPPASAADITITWARGEYT